MRFIKEFVVLILVAFSIKALSAETRKVVAVVDTGIPYTKSIVPYLCKGFQYDLTDNGIQDSHGHGTNVLGLIAKGLNPKTHCLTMIKWWHTGGVSGDLSTARIVAYSQLLVKLAPTLVNLSLSGEGYVQEEYKAIKLLLSKGTTVVVAAGNDKTNLSLKCSSYPACYPIKHKRFHVVNAGDTTFANYGGPVTDTLPGSQQRGIFGVVMSGTSQSCANKSAELLKGIN